MVALEAPASSTNETHRFTTLDGSQDLLEVKPL